MAVLMVCMGIVLLPVFLAVLLYIRSMLIYGSVDIPGPTPGFYYGNAKEIRKKGILKFFQENYQKFGPVFRYFNGLRCYIVVTDLEMLRQIMVKEFDTFRDRQHNPDFFRKKTSDARGLLNSRGEQWQRIRKILSKSFNSLNLNRMSPMIAFSCESLCNKLNEFAESERSFDMWRLCGLFTMEVILSTGFGHKIDVIGGRADQLTEACANMFASVREGSGFSGTITLLSNFPFMEWYLRRVAVNSKFGKDYLTIERKAEQLVADRLNNIKDYQVQDLLQLLIDARANDDEENDFIGPRKLSDVEIVRTAISFLLAGYETTSNALAFTTYLLATYPEEQDRLYAEINDYYSQHPDATLYEVSQNVAYLDMVLQESLRMFPPAPRVNRHCSKTINIGDIEIPEGCIVEIPIILIHQSTENWPDPDVFNPNRFTKEERNKRHPMSHMPFGWGPRSCIGMRLALMEAKMALVAILHQYKLAAGPEMQNPLPVAVGITMAPKHGVYICIERRT